MTRLSVAVQGVSNEKATTKKRRQGGGILYNQLAVCCRAGAPELAVAA